MMIRPSKNSDDGGAATISEELSANNTTYTKKTLLEHILLRPDTYVGSILVEEQVGWRYDSEKGHMVPAVLRVVPALLKIFDELLINAADNKQRDPTMKNLKVKVDVTTQEISIWNDGRGIPVEWQEEHRCFVPDLIFGQLLTSSNYNDGDKKTVGGRNGYGAKLANIFSSRFTVNTMDTQRHKLYTQTWTNNMRDRQEPILKERQAANLRDFTHVTFTPDLARFGLSELGADTVAWLQRRVFDMAGTCAGVRVWYNDQRVPVTDFRSYVQLYRFSDAAADEENDNPTKMEEEEKHPTKMEEENHSTKMEEENHSTKMEEAVKNPTKMEEAVKTVSNGGGGWLLDQSQPRWEVALNFQSSSQPQNNVVSFVNNIHTSVGGSHVKYIVDQVVAQMVVVLQHKHKQVKISAKRLRSHLFLVLNCLIENPVFDSQTKVNLTVHSKAFGSTYQVSEAFVKRLLRAHPEFEKSCLMDVGVKQEKALKKQDGRKTLRLLDVEKLDDANEAGGKKAGLCTLILTEGDSAKALAVSGLGVVGRDLFGVFPLKGKPLNVREASHADVVKNTEITAIKRIIGLKQGAEYTDVKSLRYGRIILMTDQDHDGSHIKGLLLNLFACFWPSLLRLPGFLSVFITPIVKVVWPASSGHSPQSFYTQTEYKQWCHEQPRLSASGVAKYYKGLGTSTAAEALLYFGAMERHCIPFRWESPECDRCLTLAFDKKKADERKHWMEAFVPGTFLDQSDSVVSISYADFVNRELILFSLASTERSIPSVMDGLKPSQRKVLYGCLKKKLHKEIKVVQLAGYVAQEAAYHAGEVSLHNTIIGMAQDFVGAHNVALLQPLGQFGTRLGGGHDAASPRYIFTQLAPVTEALFHCEDEPLLTAVQDDGKSVEPEYYVPLLPTVLINTVAGIATGWKSYIPNFCPLQVSRHILYRLQQWEQLSSSETAASEAMVPPPAPLRPHYRGFSGTIEPVDARNFTSSGRITKMGAITLRITELPIGTWTSNYKVYLEGRMQKASDIIAMREYHSDTTVCFDLQLSDEAAMSRLESGPGGLLKAFKLTSTLTLSQMVLYNSHGKLHHYQTVEEILDEFFRVRMDFYARRKLHILESLGKERGLLVERLRFVTEVVAGLIKIFQVSRQNVLACLLEREYLPQNEPPNFDFLLNMPIGSFTQDKIVALTAQVQQKQECIVALQATSLAELYRRDLRHLEPFLEALVVVAQSSSSVLQPVAAVKKRKADKTTTTKKVKVLKSDPLCI